MRILSEPETLLIQKFKGMPFDQIWSALSETDRRFKCHTCHHFFYESQLFGERKQCPVCGEIYLQKMCILDHNHCGHDVMSGVEYCPICNDPICLECGCHDVLQLSRVTGYLQDVSGWNSAKKQELKDRHRYNISETGIVS